jgi:tensin
VFTEAAAVDLEGTESKPATTASEVLSQGAACNVLYLTSVDMESLTGPEAVGKAVGTMLYAASSSSPDSANFPKTTFVHFKVSAQGITLTDINRRLFFRRHYPVDTVTFAGMDPEDRRWTWTSEETKKQVSARVFGFVARKHGSATDNACHVFAELDPDQPADAIANFIMKVMLGHHGRAKKHVVT